MRPQGYEIIRTWAFYTIFRCLQLTGKPPFRDIMVNGMVAGPDGRKMSKSYGNVVQPEEALEPYGADTVRQWAAMGTLGDDYPYTEKEMQYSYRFLNKFWNACRFASGHLKNVDINTIDKKGLEFNYIDKWIIYNLNKLIIEIKNDYERYNFHSGLSKFRKFFWHDFCDDYIEAVKHRLYTNDKEKDRNTALYVLYYVILNSLLMFAPIAPFITDEIHEYLFKKYTNSDSVHKLYWPELVWDISEEDAKIGELIINIISTLRSDKASKSIPLNKELSRAYIKTKDELKDFIETMKWDIMGTLKIRDLVVETKIPEEKYQYQLDFEDNVIYWNE